MIVFEMTLQFSPAQIVMIFAAGTLLGLAIEKMHRGRKRGKQDEDARLTRLRAKRAWDA